MHDIVKKLLHGVIISCQAYEDTPLYGADNMKRMAECAVIGGASGIRACWPQDIRAIRSACSLPIIGINKRFGDGDPLDDIFITPTFESAAEVIEAGADIVAVDCTIRPSRGFDQLAELLRRVREAYPETPIMADLATLDEAIRVADAGLVDIISTTLSGYTRQSTDAPLDRPNYQMIRDIKAHTDLPVNGEGRVWEVAELRQMLEAGADMVTIGSAVTRPHLITERFVKCNEEYQNHH